jgi:hypothetical protein
MVITVQGGTQAQKKYVQSVVQFCVQRLMPKMKTLDITVRMKDLKGSAYGYCMPVDGERPDRPRDFEIEVDSGMRLRRLLETICHEMVHVKQYARGELYQGVRVNKHRWQGKWINKDPEYWDQPWEIEAHGRETGLFVRWAEENNLANKSWTWDK